MLNGVGERKGVYASYTPAIVRSEAPPTGVGEPAVPPIAPAVANALRQLGHGPFDGLPLRLGAAGST